MTAAGGWGYLRQGRLEGRHSYWAVLLVIVCAFVFAALAPDAAWATSTLVLIQTATLVLAVRTAGLLVVDNRIVLGLVVAGAVSGVVGFVWSGNGVVATLDLLSGLLTLALVIVIGVGAARQGEVNSKSVAGAVCVYLLLGMMFLFVYGAIAGYGHRPFFAQGTDGTRSIRLYFSYVTLTTLGYGDYTPASSLSRALAVLEALVGGLYLVTVVAVVVSRMSGSGASVKVPANSGHRRDSGI